MLDLAITGGTVIDGSKGPARAADIGIQDGVIVEIGRVGSRARRTVDATDLMIGPGCIDIHTHYDAQVMWDSTLSSSALHGVTTAIGGNCGFTLAPVDADAVDSITRILARVEGMPLETLRAGLDFSWQSFGEYLDQVETGGVGLNVGFLVGHTTLRLAVMKANASSEASAEEIETMVGLLGRSLAEGGLGFSSTRSPTHNDEYGQPVPSRRASTTEFVALSAEIGRHAGTTLELLPANGAFSDADVELMTHMSTAADRPLNWNLLAVRKGNEDVIANQLAASDFAEKRGGCIRALALPTVSEATVNFDSGFVLDSFSGWSDVLGRPHEEKKRQLADPSVRASLEAGSRDARGAFTRYADWANYRIVDTASPHLNSLKGRRIGDLAKERGISPFDVLLDVAISDDLQTRFLPPVIGNDPESWELRASALRDERVVVGGTDAGAHVDMLVNTASTSLLQEVVRERGLMTFEEAFHQLSDVPARLYGLADRGRIEQGYRADLLIFDPAEIGPGPVAMRRDLPAGGCRLFCEAKGVHQVYVNGKAVVEEGELTGELPGKVLRSGTDTRTVRPGSLQTGTPDGIRS